VSNTARPPQAQKRQPAFQEEMKPRPQAEMRHYRGAGKLDGKIALISGGDSGIGRAVCTGFAKEGADVALTYLDEHEDAQETVRLIKAEGRRALAIAGDIGNSDFARKLVRQVVAEFGRVDVLMNNAAEQHMAKRLEDISDEQLKNPAKLRTNRACPQAAHCHIFEHPSAQRSDDL
jgi:short-subunit dehydrogenase involved in D-alanine esterification of teichoic acids